MERQKIVAGNWKMNKTLQEAEVLIDQISKSVNDFDNVLKIIIPSFPFIQSVKNKLNNKANFFIGAQNCYSEQSGAYTGEVSASMLKSVGCDYVLVGHSERRLFFKEKDEELVKKIKQILANNMKPIFCIGETIHERKTDNHFTVITSQLRNVLKEFDINDFSQFIIAYEPVWAIGTGETASPKQAQEMHAFIRETISDIYNSALAAQVPILYGGSCNAQNAQELFACKDVDGGLIGGAALKADDFSKIIFSF
jgi:triosephosphate isomerase (TIM)